jgi:hypothetical protein
MRFIHVIYISSFFHCCLVFHYMNILPIILYFYNG